MKLGLENITRLFERLGEPQKRFAAVLVAGTNGKGSVAAFISSILRAGGFKTGTFYSPHLFRVNERIRINGDEIPSPVLDAILEKPVELYEEAPFTFFEGLTAAAALYFDREEVDAAVFEVGLGGRLDATRLVNSICSVITGISYDHREHLGKTRSKILQEKLGITKRAVPLVANLGTSELVKTARRHCDTIGVPFFSVREEVRTRLERLSPDRMVFDLVTPHRVYRELETMLIGRAQVENAATAVRAVEVLAEQVTGGKRRRSSPLRKSTLSVGAMGGAGRGIGGRNASLNVETVRRGLATVSLAGRFQVLTGEPRIVLDVAHNEESLLAALDTLRRISPRERNVMIFGVLAHKELGRFPARASASARDIILTPLRERRSARPTDLKRFFVEESSRGKRRYASIRAVNGMAQALRTARKLLDPGDTLLILGSHMTVEEAAQYL